MFPKHVFSILSTLLVLMSMTYPTPTHYVSATPGDTTTRVSVSWNGEEGNSFAIGSSISADGRYVAFHSNARNLVSSGTNGWKHVFVRDTVINTTTLVSVASTGVQGNGDSERPSISADGRYVAFFSYASNLVSGDTNGNWDVFVRDTVMNTTTRVSVSSNGDEGYSDYPSSPYYRSLIPSISANGRYVAFNSDASNLVSGDTNGNWDVFVRDTVMNTTTRVSVSSNGEQGNSYSLYPSISADGRYVAFFSYASNLVSDDTNGTEDIFVRDTVINTTTLVSVASTGVQGNGASARPSISADGRYVAFHSNARNLVSGDTNTRIDVFVRDTATDTTTRVSVSSNGEEGKSDSNYPSISADGRYVAFYSYASNLVSGDTNLRSDVFVHDTATDTTTRVSVSSNGEEGNKDSNDSTSISADGRYVAFDSAASNLVSGDTNSASDVFVREMRGFGEQSPPIILVHGFQGLADIDGDPNTNGYRCSNDGIAWNDIQQYNGSNSTLGDLPKWFQDEGFQVWIAHLETSPLGTPTLQTNAECLRDQINYVAQQNPDNPITIVAHSMGGLVSRAALYGIKPSTKVKALYTLGSPHAGFPLDELQLIWGLVDNQPAVYNMASSPMLYYNGIFRNKKGIQYVFVGGDGSLGGFSLRRTLLSAFEGPNDQLVGKYGALGWIWPFKLPAPLNWQSNSLPGQFWTDEIHSGSSNSYYSPPSDGSSNFSHAFECMNAIMQGNTPTSCQDATQNAALVSATTADSTATQSVFTEIKNGSLDAGQSTSLPLKIDSDATSTFYLTWSGGTPTFTLSRPDTQLIDPVYAGEHSSEVTYEYFAGGADIPPNQTYNFSTTQPGNWQLNITASTAIEYQVLAILASPRSLTGQTNLDTYQIGDTATISTNLANGSTGISGATVIAKLTRPDLVMESVTLTDQGNGAYTANYVIPSSPGYLLIDVTASGTDGGTTFTRQRHLQVAIQSDNLQLTGSYSHNPNDGNSDGLYESLDFNVEVDLAAAGKYAVTADLYSADQYVTQVGDFFDLPSGTQTFTLPFSGDAIRQSGLNGPYTVTNLSLVPLNTGILEQNALNILTTPTYNYTQFGTCLTLTLTHTGTGSDPTANPSNSTGCASGKFVEGESIDLTATPGNGWKVESWVGTTNDASTTTTNQVNMPATNHLVTVNYVQLDPPGAFSKSSPANGATNQPLNPTISWSASTGADNYEYCYYTTNSSDCDEPWTLTTTNNSVGLSGLAYNTTYYWQVRAVNAGGKTESNGGSWWSFKTKAKPLSFHSTSTQDGWILESAENGNVGKTMNSNATTLRLGDDAARKQYRSILSFNTSSLPDYAVITKVMIKVKRQGVIGGGNPVTTFQGFMMDIKRGIFGTSALQATDWQTAAQKTLGPFKPALVGGWYTINLTPARAYINKLSTGGGLTQIRLRFKLDDNNNAIANYLSLYSGNAGVASRPQLIIEYYVP